MRAPRQPKQDEAQSKPVRRQDKAATPAIKHPAAHVLQLQRTHGNRFVRRMIEQGRLQREVGVDDMNTSVATADSGQPTSIGDGSSQISAEGGKVQISAPVIELNGAAINNHSGITTNDGVVTATVLQADSVVASNYTPGAGNLY